MSQRPARALGPHLFLAVYAAGCGQKVASVVTPGQPQPSEVPSKPASTAASSNDGRTAASANSPPVTQLPSQENGPVPPLGAGAQRSDTADPGEKSPQTNPTTATQRDPALWPYASDDPWNTSLGANALYADIDSPSTTPNGGANLNVTEWSHPIFLAKASDPLKIFNLSWRECARVRVPAEAMPDGQADAHLHIIDETHTFVVETWETRKGADGNFTASACAVNALKGSGLKDGTRGYGGSAIAGLIRKGELAKGIPHVLAIAVDGSGLNRIAPEGKCYVWPASRCDDGDGRRYNTSGRLYMGSLLAIPPNVDLKTLGLSAAGMVVGTALQDYGAYISDIGGGNVIFYVEPAAASEVPSALKQDLDKLVRSLKVVSNNSPQSVGGGGARRRPPAPPFDR